ncbi:T9SS type A sorting domain-containing protein [Flavipsychrobacter stenotrophus]|nr:T9SS type A sorting domain-containing protein [Flavipsychrobacter stenotrophus]
MRKLLVYLILLLSINASAQIVIKENQYPGSVVGTDTIKTTVVTSTFPSLTPAVGGTWDMTILSDSAVSLYDYRVSTTGYDYADSNEYALWRYPYIGNVQSSIIAAGVLDYGVTVLDTSFSLSTLTISATDSLFIPAQNIVYSSPNVIIPFNTSYGATWSSAFTKDLSFELSVTIPVMNHAPGIVRSYVSVTNNVVGWGQVRMNDIGGFPTPYFEVLQIQTRTITRDSFYLNGGLMPGALLTLFSVYQGKTDTVFEQHYQRQGEVTPLVSIQFRDGNYTQPIRARRHVQRLYPFVDGVGDLQTSASLVYPNPVTGNQLKLLLPTGIYGYRLTDVLGRQFVSGTMNVAAKVGEIALPVNIVNGCYYLHVYGSGDSRTIPVQICR